MTRNGQKTLGALAVLALAFALFCLWLLFSYTGAGHRAEVKINAIVPRWLIVVNFFILPLVTAIAAGPLRIRRDLRCVLLTLMLLSALILEVTFRRFLLESCGTLALFLLAVYWIIPKWTPNTGAFGNVGRRRIGGRLEVESQTWPHSFRQGSP